ncbi:hypothetical protein TheveDRAFT_1323 [Thermanaerovibrio velox DSM 12556]|uniref:Uncharacterized protein n=1 Tax=Thermanaerovibrio velox DSM 12556 TaxID=926567 RepID=H0UNM8_9BACT|nr:DUF5693 family protein [Thermanaerovibrio velox]EHM10443.1 hypothetical protein TheveDRAFT_1323 [Thermanaerovibrio velox DSM 12556]
MIHFPKGGQLRGGAADGRGSSFFVALLVASLCVSLFSLLPRVRAEVGNRKVGIVLEYRDLVSLAREGRATPSGLAESLRAKGLSGLLVGELTGRDLISGFGSLRLSPVRDLPFPLPVQGVPKDRAVLWSSADDPNMRLAMPYLSAKFPASSRMSSSGYLAVLLSLGMSDLLDSGLVPDFEGLELARRLGFPVLFRPLPCIGVGGGAVASGIETLLSHGYLIRGILPAGLTVAGYPQLEPLGALLRGESMFLAQPEFVKQIGMVQAGKSAFPNLIPLHSVIKDEVFSKSITREQLVERMVRAVHERTVRLLLVRPYDLYPGERLGSFTEDLDLLSASLRARGYIMGFPSAEQPVGRSRIAPFGAALALLAVMMSLLNRFSEVRLLNSPRLIPLYLGVPLLLALGASIAGGFPMKLMGALLGALGASEAALRALDQKSPLRGALWGFAVALAVGTAIGAMYGFSLYMLRVEVFSGVKLTLVLPPVMVVLNDVLKRRYPEGAEILKRPPLWGELMVAGILLAGLAFMAVRSDNTALVPQWELSFREWLERLLLVRPRTKELLGYPCLFVTSWLSARGIVPRLQEVFRIVSSLAFASAVNSFCHLHTPYPLTLLRGFNGLWTGCLIGLVLFVSLGAVFNYRAGRLRS